MAKATFWSVYSKVRLEDILNFSKNMYFLAAWRFISKFKTSARMWANTCFKKLRMSSKWTFDYTDQNFALRSIFIKKTSHFGNDPLLHFLPIDGSDKDLVLTLGILRVNVDSGLDFQNHQRLVRFLHHRYPDFGFDFPLLHL